MKTYTCKTCGKNDFGSYYSFSKHKQVEHGIAVVKRGHTAPPVSPLETILLAEKTITKALLELDTQRAGYMEKIRELDNTIAKYKKLTAHS